MATKQTLGISAVAGAGSVAVMFLLYQLGQGIVSRATGEYVKLPDRVSVLERSHAKVEEWMTEKRAEEKAARAAADAKASELERRAIWKDRAESEKRRDERLEKLLAAIVDCKPTAPATAGRGGGR